MAAPIRQWYGNIWLCTHLRHSMSLPKKRLDFQTQLLAPVHSSVTYLRGGISIFMERFRSENLNLNVAQLDRPAVNERKY